MKKTVLLLSVIALVFEASAQITSTFDTDADGWTFLNSGTPVIVNHSASGGNPTGAYVATSPYSANTTVGSQGWFAPAKFQGPQALRSYGMNLRFDLQQTFAGTASNGQGDVRIETAGGFDIVFSLPVKPAVAPAWSSYSIPLDETGGWRVSNTGGALATKADVIRALSNITTLEIRGTYITNASNISGLDNVVLEQRTLDPAPVITSFTPMAGIPGASVSINGSNFGATVAQNTVYFGTTKGTITSVSPTRIDVTVPAGAQYGAISVVNLTTGLRTKTNQSFNPLFDNNKDFGGEIIPASLSRGLNTVVQNGTEISNNTSSQGGTMGAGDIDGDGWVDLVGSEKGTQTIYVFRNVGTGGTVGVSSFATPTSLSLATIPLPGGAPTGMGEITVTDVDSDGRLDITSIVANVPTGGYLVVYRNTSTAGSISFASPVFFSYGYYSSQLRTTSADFDGDGRIDFAHTTGTSPGGIWLNQNLSTPGNVLFAYAQYIGPNNGRNDLSVGDLNGDGKPELIATRGSFEIHENTSAPGIISFNTPFLLTGTSIVNCAIADLDADNKEDLIWGGGAQVYFSRNIYSGGALSTASFDTPFQVPHLASNTYHIAVSDINGDGKPDVLAAGDIDMAIFQNRGGATLSAASFTNSTLYQASVGATTRIYPSAPVIADLDGDNKPEVMLSHTNSNIPAAAKGIYIFHNESFPAPVINSISPSSGTAAADVTLTGDFMFTGNETPTIRLNNINSVVNSPTNTSTATQVPAGAMSGKFSVTNHGLTGYSSAFNLTFATDRAINASSFGPSINFALSNNVREAIDVADFDDDGRPEVLVTDNFSTGRIFKNTHATSGQPITTSSLTVESTTYSSGFNLKTLDIDGDGKMDLNSGFNLFQNTTSGSISFATGVSTRPTGFNYAVTSDFNKDGKTDLALTDGTGLIRVHTNQSSRGAYAPIGNFSPFSEAVVGLAKVNGAGGLVAADFDNDGSDDLIATNTVANSITIYRNEKVTGPITTASFSLIGNNSVTGLQPYNVTANDFDGDGKVDLAITYFNSTFISIYRNNGSVGTISFSAAVDITCANKGFSIASQDLDGDGKAEIVVIHQPNPGPGSFSVFKNTSTSGTVSFATPINYALGRNPLALSIADINLDQKPDILIVATGGATAPANALMIFENKILSIPPPTISSFAPASGPVGTTVTITGTNFDTTPTNNIVYFGAVKATVTAAISTQLTVTVPAGSTYEPISASVGGLTAHAPRPFVVTFTGGGFIDDCSFAPAVTIASVNTQFFNRPAFADIDEDGKPDLIIPESLSNQFSIFRNISTLGTVSTGSFAAPLSFATANQPSGVAVGDLDGDGKRDFAVLTYTGGKMSIYKNLSTAGTISLASKVDVDIPSFAHDLAIADVDGDGKQDLSITTSLGGLTVFRNMGSTGVINASTFASGVSFSTGSNPQVFVLGDIDGDGKMDAAVSNSSAFSVSLLRNTSTPGLVSFAAEVVLTTATGSPAPGQGMYATVLGDIDGDNKLDLISTNLTANTYSIYRNTSTVGTFSFDPKYDLPSVEGGNIETLADFDGDGKIDFTTSYGSDSIAVYKNVSASGIINASSFSSPVTFARSPSAVLLNGDVDGDGRNEIITTSESLQIFRNIIGTISPPTITSFTPTSGPVGASVTINGTNFTTPFTNTVEFNGVPATITASTATSLTVTVPAGATTGKIAVTIGCNTVMSVADFIVGVVINEPPVIQPTVAAVPINGIVTIALLPLISDPDNNLDVSTLSLVSGITAEGASATLVGDTDLELNYGNIVFAGTDRISISVCDLLNACTEQELSIEVSGEIKIFNAVSANGDDKNPYFRIENIAVLEPTNTVTIYNRWGSKVFEADNYAESNAFRGLNQNGNELPSGTYFYKISFKSSRKTQTGYLSLKR